MLDNKGPEKQNLTGSMDNEKAGKADLVDTEERKSGFKWLLYRKSKHQV